jgi:hypothetical protein
MRTLILFLFTSFSLFTFAQDVEKDYDAVDSLYREDQFYFSISYNSLIKSPEGLTQRKFSPGISFGFLRDMPINKKRTISIAAGAGYMMSVFNHNIAITETANTNVYDFINTNVAFKINRHTLHYLDIPIEFRWRNSTFESHKFWRIYGGFKISYLLYDQYKLVSDAGVEKQTHNKDFNQFTYGTYLSFGYNSVNFYIYYGLNPIFKNTVLLQNERLDFSAVKFGLMFYIL